MKGLKTAVCCTSLLVSCATSEERDVQRKGTYGALNAKSEIIGVPWGPDHGRNDARSIRVDIHADSIVYWYHGQCQHVYRAEYNAGISKMYWTFRSDCLLDLDHLESNYDPIGAPERDSLFAEFFLLNDSTVKVTYAHQEWVRAVNSTVRDSIFPDFLHTYRPLSEN